MRDPADAADGARKRVAELDQDRSRALVHDLLVYLRLDKFAEADDQTRAVMITQAQAKHQQMRSYVDGAAGARRLAELVDAVLALHPGDRTLRLDELARLSSPGPSATRRIR